MNKCQADVIEVLRTEMVASYQDSIDAGYPGDLAWERGRLEYWKTTPAPTLVQINNVARNELENAGYEVPG